MQHTMSMHTKHKWKKILKVVLIITDMIGFIPMIVVCFVRGISCVILVDWDIVVRVLSWFVAVRLLGDHVCLPDGLCSRTCFPLSSSVASTVYSS